MKLINIYTDKEIKKIYYSAKISAKILEKIQLYIKPGITTEKINNICHKYIIKKNAIPASLGYQGYPKSICTSINEVVCHGIPNKKEILKDGDIINLDIAVIKNGFFSDTSKMFIVGKPTKQGKKLCKTAQKSLYIAINNIYPGKKLNIIGKKIEKYIKKKNFSIVKEYCGHGIGKKFHENPYILHYKNNYTDIQIKKGMVFTIEPMINYGKKEIYIEKNGWTVKTKDKSLSAQYEHTIAVTQTGCKILTHRKDDLLPINIKYNNCI